MLLQLPEPCAMLQVVPAIGELNWVVHMQDVVRVDVMGLSFLFKAMILSTTGQHPIFSTTVCQGDIRRISHARCGAAE